MLKASRKSYIFLFLFGFMVIFAAFRPIGFDSDSIGYTTWIQNDLIERMAEPTFALIVAIWDFLSPKEYVPRMVLITYAVFNMLILKLAINNFSDNKNQAFFLYFLLLYSILTLTQIRVGLASAVFFWAMHDIFNEKKMNFIFKMILSINIHNLMVIFIPFYFINKRRKPISYFIFFWPLFVFALLFSNQVFMFFTDILMNSGMLPIRAESKIISYLNEDGVAISVFNYHTSFVLVVYFLALSRVTHLNQKDFFLLECVGYGMVLYFLTTFMTVMSGRVLNVVVLMCIVLVPGVVRGFKDKYLVLVFLYIYAFALFLNTHLRNNLLDFGVFF
jgi:hypothetical protein